MKVIDLLNKIANGEEVPKKIKNNNNCMIYEFDSEYNMYMGGDTEEYYTNAIIIMGKVSLNTEVEIIEDTPKEDKKITKLDNNIAFYEGIYQTCWNDREVLLVSKINEIIDKVNGE